MGREEQRRRDGRDIEGGREYGRVKILFHLSPPVSLLAKSGIPRSEHLPAPQGAPSVCSATSCPHLYPPGNHDCQSSSEEGAC